MTHESSKVAHAAESGRGAEENSDPVEILFVAGFGRSGSTVLGQLLHEVDGLIDLGEVRHLWQRGWTENQLCACGSSFHDCGFWMEVLDEAFDGQPERAIRDAIILQEHVDRISQIPKLFWPRLQNWSFRDARTRYGLLLSKVYRTLKRRTDAKLLVDTSKTPMHGLFLTDIPGFQVHVLQLVRDSRASAFSWQRKKKRPEIHWKKEMMPRYSSLKSSVWWAGANQFASRLGRFAESFQLMRYEDLIAAPADEIRQMLQRIDPALANFSHIHGQTASVSGSHSVSGNPARFSSGEITLRPDSEWETKMPRISRAVVSTLTSPWLLKYGYFRKRPAAAPNHPAETVTTDDPSARQAG